MFLIFFSTVNVIAFSLQLKHKLSEQIVCFVLAYRSQLKLILLVIGAQIES